MIKSLTIHNFRCFRQSEFSGFERVNLIGGQNNSGKTAFLEALHLNSSPLATTVMQMRGVSQETIAVYPERVWNGLFFNNDNQIVATITATDENEARTKVQFCQKMHSSKTRNYINGLLKQYVTNREINPEELETFVTQLNNPKAFLTSLEIRQESPKYGNTSTIFATIGINKIIEYNENSQPIVFISACQQAPNQHLVEQYEKSLFKGYEPSILTALQIIDPSIITIRTVTTGEPTLYLSRNKQRPISLALFGDAINRVMRFVIGLVNNEAGILLIDEIENGIHHMYHKQLWQFLFQLATELNVQIFATTHSIEMLSAFKEAAINTEYEQEVAYFELARHVKTNEIVALKHEMSELAFAIERDMEIRGE